MVQLLLQFTCAERIDNWHLHFKTTAVIIPILISMDRPLPQSDVSTACINNGMVLIQMVTSGGVSTLSHYNALTSSL